MINPERGEESWRAVISKPLKNDRFEPLSARIELEIGAASDCGAVQTLNTDHYLAVRLSRRQEILTTSLASGDLPQHFEEHAYSMLVADGIGEGPAGARASRAALSAIAYLAIMYGQWTVRVEPETPGDVANQAAFLYRRTHEAVVQASHDDLRLADMATSLTATYIAGSDLFFAHVGHSRAFLFRSGVLTQLTTDHTLHQGTTGSRRPRGFDLTKVDLHHVVTETIGGRSSGGPDVDVEHVRLWSGDRVLLCTNGLTDVVSEDQIADILAIQRHPQDDCSRLIDRALANGSPDNITVVLADYTVRSTNTGMDSGSPDFTDPDA